MEVVARQLLLLYVSLSAPESMGMQGGCGGSFTSYLQYTVLLNQISLNSNVVRFGIQETITVRMQQIFEDCSVHLYFQRKQMSSSSCSGTARSALKPTTG